MEKILEKVNASFSEGNYYEAHQQYRTLYNRLKRQKKWQDALQLTSDGAIRLLDAGQIGSGADLADLYVKTLGDAKVKVCAMYIDTAVSIMDAYTKCLRSSSKQSDADKLGRDEFMRQMIKWSASQNDVLINGDALLYHLYGEMLYNEQEYQRSIQQLVQGNEQSCAVLAQIASNASDQYSTALQILLTMLSNGNQLMAEQYWKQLTQHADISQDAKVILDKGLSVNVYGDAGFCLNYGEMLLIAIKYNVINIFKLLDVKYPQIEGVIKDYKQMKSKIGQLHFGITPAPTGPQQGGLNIGALLNSLMQSPQQQQQQQLHQ
ncbi:hypothetical protein MP228_002424 [Amoeboaphelidium protococcarum]|nr:hypothetical protein MP228_002424 [Amoeboaphelidium protococcarum]